MSDTAEITIKEELSERHSSCVQTFGHYLSWFTFFTTVNLIGFGWFGSVISGKDFSQTTRYTATAVCLYFLANNCLAIAVTKRVQQHFRSELDRISRLVEILNTGKESDVRREVSTPCIFYLEILSNAMYGFPTMMVLWLAVCGAAWFVVIPA